VDLRGTMVNILEVTPDDIKRLDEKQLPDLLSRLLRMEAYKYEIPKSCISYTLNTKAADGGEDAHIKWDGEPDKTEWLPNKYTLFQCKATKMSVADCKNEITYKPRVKGECEYELKIRVKDVFDNDGSYILFCIDDYTVHPSETSRLEAFREAIKSTGAPYYETVDIQIYDANKICMWVNQYISLIVQVNRWIRNELPNSMDTWEDWKQYPENDVEYVQDEILSGHISQLKSHFIGAKKIARIVGLSGLGKTRLALEVFRPLENTPESIESQMITDQVVYIDAANESTGLPGEIKQWRNRNLEGILVVDNCELELHQRLRREIEHPDSRLSLLTLDYNPESNDDENVIPLQPASNEVIEGIIKQSCPGLRDIDIKRIIEFADGFPQIAVMLANARLNDAPDIGDLKDKVLIDKLLWGRESKNEEAYKVIKSCSLFTHIGFSDEVIDQSDFIALNICKLPKDVFRDYAVNFIDRGILDRRNRFIRVVPAPLAMRLAAEWWIKCHPDTAKNLLTEYMPDGMAEAMCDQISKLHYVSEAQKLTKELCGETAPFGQAEVLNSDKGSRLFRSLVEVNPVYTAFALERAFGSWNKQQLYEIKAGRRNLVWALEKLCFWEETFPVAARILLSFAVAENETWGNNSTNQFYQLFHYILSGTQAPPELRLRVLDEFLNGNDLDYKKIAVEALGHALHTNRFVRDTGAEIQGSRPPLEEWKPKKWQEVFDYWTECFNRLNPFIVVDDELGSLARKQITDNMRGLVQAGRLEDIEFALKSVCRTSDIHWLEALNEIKTIIHFDKCKLPSEGYKKLKEWLELLEPKTFVQRWKSTVSNPSYGLLFEKDDEYKDKSQKLVSLFAEECSQNPQELLDNLRIVFVGGQKKGYNFGYAFGKNTTMDDEFIRKSLDTLKSVSSEDVDISVLCGFVHAIHPTNTKLIEEMLDAIAEDDILYIYTLSLTCSIEPTRQDLNRTIELVKAKKIVTDDLRIFAFGGVLQHIPPEHVIAFVEDILNLGDEGILPALEILHMYTFQDGDKFNSCSTELQKVVQTTGILSILGKSTNNLDKYNFNEIIIKLLTAEAKNDSLAANISKEFTSICSSENFAYTLNSELTKIFRILFTRYLDVIWPIFSKILLSKDKNHYYLKLYLKPDNNMKFYSEGVFGEIREDIIVEWCTTNPDKAPAIVAELIPLFVEHDNECSFSPIAKYLLHNFGDKKDVQSALHSNMWCFGSIGSRVPYYEKQIEALQKIEVGNNLGLDSWILKMVIELEERIKDEKGREEERELGIF